ncbi:tetratricopeptide repeat protein [Nocardia concava]|uniref:tetratricopeptide repeat protein n=1 Tax=Nocardia concava TaxID=257281 RepID=UPI0002FD5DAF|nr:tetratricopeptide repeat protein [Nocardia concava]
MVVPHEVPLGPRVFVNRRADFEWVDNLWAAERAAGTRVGVCAGLPGIGKTAFVRRCVERARAARTFADGDLCVDFGRVDGVRPSVADALATCLMAVGVSEDAVPASLAARTNLLRSLTAEKSVLIVLEDVTDAAQVVPFLPISASSSVLVTSNARLSELVLDGAEARYFEPLDGAAGAELIGELVGERARREPGAVVRLVRLCAGLPVALKVAAAKLVARPMLRIESLVASIETDDSGLVAYGRAGWEAVAAVFSDAYEGLDDEAARLYRLLGVFPGRDLSAETASALIGRDAVTTEMAVSELIEAGLLSEDSNQRLSLHSLLRRHAGELSERLDAEKVRDDALRAVARHLLLRAAQADIAALGTKRFRCTPDDVVAGYRSPFTGAEARRSGLDWLDAERPNLLAVQRVAAERGWHELAWQLGEAMTAVFVTRRYYVDWTVSSEIAVASARLAGNRRAEARLRSFVSRAWLELERPERAREELLVEALPLAESAGDGRLLASVWEFVGRYREATGDIDGAIAAYARSIELFNGENDARGTAFVTFFLARAYRSRGDLEQAEQTMRTARSLIEALVEPDPRMVGRSITELGRILDERGESQEARTLFTEAARMLAGSGDAFYEAAAHERLWQLGQRLGDRAVMREALERMVSIHRILGTGRADSLSEELRRVTGPE